MDISLKDRFVSLWERYFDGAELPVAFYYTRDASAPPPLAAARGHMCVMAQVARVRRGEDVCLGADSVGCFGGRRYLGFAKEPAPDLEHFLAKGIPGKLEGERYKTSPEIVRETYRRIPAFEAPAPYIVFKRWDRLTARDEPVAVFFIARPDVVSGLFTLANFDEGDPKAVIAPFGAGCAAIVQYPYDEARSDAPRAVLGMFDVSARPFVGADELSFAVPMSKFARMIDNMEESFLITESWSKVRLQNRDIILFFIRLVS